MKKNGRLVAIALGSVLCASCVGGAFLVAGNAPAAETVRAAESTNYNYSWLVSSGNEKLFGQDGTTEEIGGITWEWNNTNNQAPGYCKFEGNSYVHLGSGSKNFKGGTLSADFTNYVNGSIIKGARILTSSKSGSGTIDIKVGNTVLGSDIKTSSWSNDTPLSPIELSFEEDAVGELSITFSPVAGAFYFGGIELYLEPAETFERIEIAGQPTKTDYYVGEKFDLDGLVVNGYVTGNDAPSDITSLIGENWVIEPEIFEAVGTDIEVYVIAGYGELTADATFYVNVSEVPSIDMLVIENEPSKMSYKVGDKTDFTGLKVVAHFGDGHSEDITQKLSLSSHTFTLEDGLNGEFTYEIDYLGYTTNLKFKVDFDHTIAEYRAQSNGYAGTFAGVVTGAVGVWSNSRSYNIYVSDGESSILIYNYSSSSIDRSIVGKRIAVDGEKTTFNGLVEVDATDIFVGEAGDQIAPYEVSEFDSDSLKGLDSSVVVVSGLTYKNGNTANSSGTNASNIELGYKNSTITMRAPTAAAAAELSDDLDQFLLKTKGLEFTFTGHLGWYNGPQLAPISMSEFSCPDYDAVMAFINSYMKPDVSQSDEGDGKSCLEWYPAAKAALEALTETQRNFFLTSDTTAAYANRYNNWAKAYGEGATSSLGTIMSSNDTAAIIALVALSSATVAAAGFMIASRRRKAK